MQMTLIIKGDDGARAAYEAFTARIGTQRPAFDELPTFSQDCWRWVAMSVLLTVEQKVPVG